MATRAYSYIRFSTPEQQHGDSHRRQTKMAEQYAATHGLELDGSLTISDLGVSAFHGDNVETGALGAFLAAVKAGDVQPGSVLLVEALDRISRRVARKAVRTLEDLVESGVDVVTLADGKRYTKESLDGFDFLMAVLLMIRGNEESATKSRRLKEVWGRKRAEAKDKVLTGRVPAWLEVRDGKTAIRRDRAAVVRRIFRMYLSGTGKAQIALTLNRERVPTFGKSKYWQRSYLLKVLTNPAVVGTYTPHILERDPSGKKRRVPQEPVRDYYPRVISDEDFERASTLTAGDERSRRRANTVASLVAGLARCPSCGGAMTRVTKGRSAKAGPPQLICVKARAGAGCKHVSVRLSDVERAIFSNAAELARNCPHGDGDLESEISGLESEIFEHSREVEGWADTLAAYPSKTLAAKVARGEQRLSELAAKLDELRARAALSDSKMVRRRAERLGAALASNDATAGNAALRECFSGVVVDYRGGALRLNWRHGGETEVPYALPAA